MPYKNKITAADVISASPLMDRSVKASKKRKLSKEDRGFKIIELARDTHESDGILEIDDNAKLSESGDNGCYVAAWVWVDFSGTKFDKEKN